MDKLHGYPIVLLAPHIFGAASSNTQKSELSNEPVPVRTGWVTSIATKNIPLYTFCPNLKKGSIMTSKIEKVLYTAKVKTTGGRIGEATSSDGNLKIQLQKPTELGGTGTAANPEQLFAAGYAACFIGAMKFIAGTEDVTLPESMSVNTEVDFGPIEVGFGVSVRMLVDIPGYADAESLVEKAHKICPYSNATRNNIDVIFTVTK